jgi:hypothetical protein
VKTVWYSRHERGAHACGAAGGNACALRGCVATEYGSALLPAYESVAVLQGAHGCGADTGRHIAEEYAVCHRRNAPVRRRASRNIGQACAEAGVECGGWCVSAPIWR